MVCSVVLLLRLIEVQVLRGSEFATLAEENRVHILAIPAPRGALLDRYKDPLVVTTKKYIALQDATVLYSKRSEVERKEALQLMASDAASLEISYRRSYLFPEETAHVVGYVGPITAEDRKKYPDIPLDTQIGKGGLERVLDDRLRGREGSVLYEVNAFGKRQREIAKQPAVPGETISTTLDPYLSKVAFAALGNNNGSVLVSDAQTGEVLVSVNAPSYNPELLSTPELNETSEAARQRTIQSWFADKAQPFFNRAVAGSYPPGSVFKLVTAIAGLEQEKITTATTVSDEGFLKVGEYIYGNWYFRQFGKTEGSIDLIRAIARSNDIFFYKAAEWVGPTDLAVTASLFGFGVQPKIESAGVATGLVPTPDWKEKKLGERWFLGNTYHMGIGQGDVLVSPLQVEQMTQTFANQGILCRETFLAENSGQCQSIGVREASVNTVLQGMIAACSPGGTAFPFFERNASLKAGEGSVQEQLTRGVAACKTGTAEFGESINEKGYRKTHGWFTVLAEPLLAQSIVEDELHTRWIEAQQKSTFPQKIVITVLIESDEAQPFKEGSRDAGPVAKALLDWIEGRKTYQEIKDQLKPVAGSFGE